MTTQQQQQQHQHQMDIDEGLYSRQLWVDVCIIGGHLRRHNYYARRRIFERLVNHAGCIAAGVGTAFSRICLFVCLSVCPRSKGTWLKLSTPNLVYLYSKAVAQHALTQRSKGGRHTVTKAVTVARFLVTRAATATLLMLAWVCMSMRLPYYVF